MNPASTMKLLTTFAALETLGPDYRWRTQVFASRRPVDGRVDGDLIVRGSGDPSFVIERWWLLLQRLRALGVRDIQGDLVLDRSAYAQAQSMGPTLDGNELRPYNVAPDALLINFKTLSLDFVPDPAGTVAHIIATPQLDGVHIPAQVPLADGPCADWKDQLRADFSQPHFLRFAGNFARACGNKTWHVSLLSPNEYALATFRALWKAAGGTLHGHVREGLVEPDAVPLAEHESPPLSEIIRDINKNSNNVMARQLFLTLGSAIQAQVATAPDDAGTVGAPQAETWQGEPEPAGTVRSIRVMRNWLDQQGLRMPELVLQNGSGLSRQERVSAASLAQLLVHAWRSSQMPNFLASLPLAGVDGTMKKRPAASGAAYVKTGYLSDVRALAGYVFAASGRHYAVVALINDAHAQGAQAAHDELLDWIWREG
jgi:D-alanyl-D-alanine carboxypeptidase/D-alanyl-D-alanine-endopeptidase (penicillin-binding protein 4)